MRQENVEYFSDKEEEFINIFIESGTGRNVAKVLVFLASTPEATSRAIERGTDMRQPEISLVMKNLTNQGWIKDSERAPESKGRPTKVYKLAKPISVIIDSIEKEKKNKIKNHLALVKKLRNYLN
jgi:predicted transcriptional regulator